MTDLELKKLKDDLWHAADVLRSGAGGEKKFLDILTARLIQSVAA